MKYQGWFDKILLILKLQFAKLKPELLSLFPDTRSYSNKMSEPVRSLRFQSLLQLPFVFPFLVFSSPLQPLAHKPTGCPKKMLVLSTYDFYLGRFLGVNFGNKKNIRLFSNKLKSLKVAKWRKDEWRMMKDEWWGMNDDDFKLFRVLWLTDRQTDERTNGHLWM